MIWDKKGKIDLSEYINEFDFVTEFATLPTPLKISDEIIRVYVGFCNRDNVSSIGFVDVSADDPTKVLNVSRKPILEPGRPGCFDDNGVVPLSVIEHNGKILLYYVGFQLATKVPYFMFGGLAVSNDGEKFERFSEVPVLDRRDNELYARCGMYAVKEADAFKMWYIGTLGGVDKKR